MNRKKVILSIFLMIFLVLTVLILPGIWKNQKNEESEKAKNTPLKETESHSSDNAYLKFKDFAALKAFFSESQISSLKEQFALYLSVTDIKEPTAVTFQPAKTSYPTETSVCLLFELSDGFNIPVTYHTPTGVFLFGEEGIQVTDHSVSYQKPTDDSLPTFTPEEIEHLPEGGYPDTTDTPQESEIIESEQQLNEEVQK